MKSIDNITKYGGLDNTSRPIIAFDFDGTISLGHHEDGYPEPGEIRKYAKRVINLLHDCGAVVVIWTCRDSYDDYDDIQPMRDWLHEHGVKGSAINSSYEYAPFPYESRKIYAHMYVDDRAFGWYDDEDIMLEVLRSFLVHTVGVPKDIVVSAIDQIQSEKGVCQHVRKQIEKYIHGWRV